MPIEPIQKPNIGAPEFVTRRRGRRAYALVTTIAFAIFWVYGLYILAGFFTGRGIELVPILISAMCLVLGLWGRRQVERE